MLIRAWELAGSTKGCWMTEAATSDDIVKKMRRRCIAAEYDEPVSNVVVGTIVAEGKGSAGEQLNHGCRGTARATG